MGTRADGRHGLRAELAWGAAAVLVACVVTFVALHLWDADLRVPFSYGGDAGQNQLIVKGVLDHGWYQHNADLGAPFGQKLYDFPVVSGDNLQILIMKALGVFTNDSALVINLFFLLSFPLAALTAYACSRALRVSRAGSAVVGILFAVLPAHFLRGETHLFIQAYYAVPIGAFLALRAAADTPRIGGRGRLAVLIAACVIVGSAHVYYAAFTLVLLLVAAVIRLVTGPRRSVATAAVFFGLIAATVVANHLPNIIYQSQHGKNAATQRPADEAETYGLKLAQLVLPAEGHRVAPLRKLRKRYDENGAQKQEGDPQALGTVATVGLLGLLVFGIAALIGGRRRATRDQPFLLLAGFSIAALLVGTVGGFSSVWAYLASTGQLRAWGRISVFIAFFSLVAVAIASDRLALRRGTRTAMALLAAIVIIGCIDQTSARSVPTYAATQTEYRSDAALVGQIEDRLPAGAAVFQLPYEPFPEPQPQWIPVAGPYDLARGYIHSHDLRWSYGLMKGRAGDWEAAAVQLPPPMLARAVVAAGFSGIYIDRSGYADNGEHVVAALLRETRAEAIASPNGRLAFLDLRTYAQRLRAKHSAVQVAALRRSVLHPLGVRVAGGPSDLKQDLQGRYYNAGQREQILIDNYDTQTRHVRIRLGLEPAFPAPATVRVVVAGQAADQVDVPAKGKTFGRELDLPPGVTPIELRTVGQPQADLPADPQTFYLRIRDPLVVDEAFDAFGGIPNSRRASAWLSPFGPI